MAELDRISVLTFDLFGTILDLGGSLIPRVSDFLSSKGENLSATQFWEQWRNRQRIEQYQDTILMLGHSGYLETVRKAFLWTLKLNGIEVSEGEVGRFMMQWQELSPFPEVVPALARLKASYRLVVVSNGEPAYLRHLTNNRIQWDFDEVISVQEVGAFKPHPGVYRRAACRLGIEVGECMMVSSNSFDVMGARSCGFRAAFVDRYGLPYEETPFRPDLKVRNFSGLADSLLSLSSSKQ